ncbi:13057_t:CDS:2 [Dentiscutata erythropus]|uniref:13057_t:CDS:1 n=1 Tax=Dentiscutata erythropus TaxID=1348616 RepID=A0A9N9BKY8_9GLOM|nr:13057_t:CDS:2 [Dentiscutata erythropus]
MPLYLFENVLRKSKLIIRKDIANTKTTTQLMLSFEISFKLHIRKDLRLITK